jgi:hypothetical protein
MLVVLVPATGQAQAKPGLRVISPAEGARITSTDIPVEVDVSNFTMTGENVGLPDVGLPDADCRACLPADAVVDV